MPNTCLPADRKSKKPFIEIWGLGFDWEFGFGHWDFVFRYFTL